jgi:surfactin synthase thioesterase subunit
MRQRKDQNTTSQGGRYLAIICDDDPRVTTDEARAWAQHSTGPFDLRVYPGGHCYLIGQSRRVIQLFSDGLAAARQGTER